MRVSTKRYTGSKQNASQQPTGRQRTIREDRDVNFLDTALGSGCLGGSEEYLQETVEEKDSESAEEEQ